ncbi:MAG TPA: sterol desaturase family protein [Ferruginibacter sp.]|nr:sterol desaturase family protein [Ferruginibacter sp.]
MEQTKIKVMAKNVTLSLFIYVLPIVLMIMVFYFTGQHPWDYSGNVLNIDNADTNSFLGLITSTFKHIQTWGLTVIVFVLAIAEFSLGMYEEKWTKNEKILDIVCFVLPKIIITPVLAYFSLKFLPVVIPSFKNEFFWVPFWWGFAIIAIADDLTQYWYHRLHHQIPFLWRFHRTHHSAPYMGMAMNSRQNFIYTIFFSQIYVTATLVYLGLGFPALFVRVIKSLITLSAHSSIPWDKPFYEKKWLHPIAWVLERFISTPATHHAHHADSADDGIGNYKGNFGNMFFIWDILFCTGIITRQYPKSFGLKYYQGEEWYAQLLWPIFKSRKEGSELSANGPEVFDEQTNVNERTRLVYQTK